MRRWLIGSAALVALALIAASEMNLLFSTPVQEPDKKVAPPKVAASKITRVTIYPNSALVTREVDVPAGDGLIELTVSPMPEQIIDGSLYSEGAPGIRVLTSRYRTRPVLEDVSEERRKINNEIEKLQIDAARIVSEIGSVRKNMEMLNKLENFTDKTTVMSTEKGGLNGDTVITLVKFVMDQRGDKAKELVALNEQKRINDQKLEFQSRKLAELGAGKGHMERDAVITVDRDAGAKGKVRLNYLVADVRWSPEYKLRAGKANEDVQLDYLATIHQNSGEDWNHVNVALSTAQPMLNSAPPELLVLSPVLVARGAPGNNPSSPMQDTNLSASPFAEGKKVQELQKMAQDQRTEANVFNKFYVNPTSQGMAGASGSTSGSGRSGNPLAGMMGGGGTGRPAAQSAVQFAPVFKEATMNWNRAAALEQQVEYMKSKEDIAQDNKRNVAALDLERNDGPSISYHLKAKLSVPSRNDDQIIEVAKLSLPPKFYYKAVPVLSRNVYLLADLTNTSDQILLPGEATVFQGTDFVGRMSLPLVAMGEEFTAGFGVDPQLQIQRQMMDKSRGMQGGNQVLKFEYRILVSSFKKDAVKVQVWDRLPHAEAESVGINLLKSSPELSKDAMYLRESRPNNLLRWDLEIEANRTGEKALAINYEFKMELDRQMAISGFQSGGRMVSTLPSTMPIPALPGGGFGGLPPPMKK